MGYEDVDKILIPWLKRYGLHVFTIDRDYEVRTIDVVDDAGSIYGIRISKPDEEGQVSVSTWGNKRQTKVFKSHLSGLEEVLEGAYLQVTEWVKQAGHTRTPVL